MRETKAIYEINPLFTNRLKRKHGHRSILMYLPILSRNLLAGRFHYNRSGILDIILHIKPYLSVTRKQFMASGDFTAHIVIETDLSGGAQFAQIRYQQKSTTVAWRRKMAN
jgi:hypothetical protein